MAEERVAVAVIGAGPAGLAAAAAMAERGLGPIIVLERETRSGGIPRHCVHSPFGLREFGRLATGPGYARRLVAMVRSLGVEIRTGTAVVALGPGGRLDLATPDGARSLGAERVLIATGVRETPRAARLLPGDRPAGILTTGAVQAMVHLSGLIPFRRPVILGTELVAFSALLTCRGAGIRPVAMVEPNLGTTARFPAGLLPRCLGVPLWLGTEITDIAGRDRVGQVTVRHRDGRTRTVAADGVLVTGGFVPAAELIRCSHLALDPGSQGPLVDQFGRCSDPVYFAAGNILHPVETAAWSFFEGRAIGGAITDDLAGRLPAAAGGIDIVRGDAVRYVVPQRLSGSDSRAPLPRLQLRADRPVAGTLTVRADGRPIWHRSCALVPERRLTIALADLPIPRGTRALRVGVDASTAVEERP